LYKKAIATEMLLTLGVLIAAGIALIQIKSIFYGEQDISKQEVINQFANDIDSIIDKCSSTTGNTSFDYNPSIKKYKLEVKDNVITIQDRLTNKTVQFVKTNINLKDTTVIDSRTIHISKNKDNVFIIGRCLEAGEECSSSFVCCNKYCWGDSTFICQNQCADNGVRAADDESCCSGFLNKTTGLCDVPPFCPANRVCPGAPEAEIIGSEDCCPMDKPVCTSGHCCPSDKPNWCQQPDSGNARCMDDDEYKEICSKICPNTISVCYDHWHWNHYGTAQFYMNVRGKACDYYETCYNPIIQQIAKEIIECCDNKCSGNCHALCNKALQDSGLSSTDSIETRKKCYGLYAIYGLGPAARWLKGYQIHLEEPASVMLTQGTWMCTGYSIEVTTLLRSVGYSPMEVQSCCGPRHAYNIVKFPGESKYRFVDTVGNSLYISGITSSDWYRVKHGYCRTSWLTPCQNDEYYGTCPSKSDIILGASC